MSVFQFSVQMNGSSSVFLLCPGVDNAVCANWAASGLLMQNKNSSLARSAKVWSLDIVYTFCDLDRCVTYISIDTDTLCLEATALQKEIKSVKCKCESIKCDAAEILDTG